MSNDHTPQGPIEVDDDSSSYGESLESDTTSLKSHLYNYTYENGRRYTRSGTEKFDLPNDETEQDRLDMFHHLHLLVMNGKLHFAPLENPQRILDCGTGTGIWALDMAETYHSAEVIGVDIVPIQPEWTFPNCRFEVDDLEQDWTYPKDHFDYIHTRLMQQSIKDWDRYFCQLYEHTKPGGYIEVVDHDFFATSDDGTYEGSNIEKFFTEFKRGCDKIGVKLQNPETYKAAIEQAGFTDISVSGVRFPCGPWPKNKHLKQAGAMGQLVASTGYEAHSLGIFTGVLGMSTEEAKKVCSDAIGDMHIKKRVHAYTNGFNIIARKPDAEAC